MKILDRIDGGNLTVVKTWRSSSFLKGWLSSPCSSLSLQVRYSRYLVFILIWFCIWRNVLTVCVLIDCFQQWCHIVGFLLDYGCWNFTWRFVKISSCLFWIGYCLDIEFFNFQQPMVLIGLFCFLFWHGHFPMAFGQIGSYISHQFWFYVWIGSDWFSSSLDWAWYQLIFMVLHLSSSPGLKMGAQRGVRIRFVQINMVQISIILHMELLFFASVKSKWFLFWLLAVVVDDSYRCAQFFKFNWAAGLMWYQIFWMAMARGLIALVFMWTNMDSAHSIWLHLIQIYFQQLLAFYCVWSRIANPRRKFKIGKRFKFGR